MFNNHSSSDKTNPIILLLIYLFLSILSGLLFSIFAFKAKRRNKVYAWWWFLSLLSIILSSFIAYIFLATSSSLSDTLYYYLGFITLGTNGIALIILIKTLIN